MNDPNSFITFVVTYSRRSGQSHNNTPYTERAAGAVRRYYEKMNGIIPGKGRGFDFTRKIRGVASGLGKLRTAAKMSRTPLLGSEIWAIRNVMKMDDLRDVTYWAL